MAIASLLRRARSRPNLRALPCVALCAALLIHSFAQPTHANWLGKVIGAAEQTGARAGKHGLGALDNAVAHVRTLPAKADGAILAAQATQEGHWRFVNRAGETFTAGTPEELKRVTAVLLPDAKARRPAVALPHRGDDLPEPRGA